MNTTKVGRKRRVKVVRKVKENSEEEPERKEKGKERL